MKVYRASRGPYKTFNPLDSKPSIRGPLGWRYNDLHTEILYAASCESLAVLEVALRPGIETIKQIRVFEITVPDNSIVHLADLGILLPSNWANRPAADDSRAIAREFFDAIDNPGGKPKAVGLFVPSVASHSDFTVLLDPRQIAGAPCKQLPLIPFEALVKTKT